MNGRILVKVRVKVTSLTVSFPPPPLILDQVKVKVAEMIKVIQINHKFQLSKVKVAQVTRMALRTNQKQKKQNTSRKKNIN